MKDNKVIQTYVYYEDKCFFVSTIERDSSAIDDGRYNETIVWKFDIETRMKGEILFQEGDRRGSIHMHLIICEQLFKTGIYKNLFE